MPGSAWGWLLFALVCGAIVVVDYHLGAEAEYLDAYAILQRSGLSWLPQRGTSLFWAEAACGRWALPVAWGLWMLEAALVTAVLRGVGRLLGF